MSSVNNKFQNPHLALNFSSIFVKTPILIHQFILHSPFRLLLFITLAESNGGGVGGMLSHVSPGKSFTASLFHRSTLSLFKFARTNFRADLNSRTFNSRTPSGHIHAASKSRTYLWMETSKMTKGVK